MKKLTRICRDAEIAPWATWSRDFRLRGDGNCLPNDRVLRYAFRRGFSVKCQAI
jgi:hypothetical protein